MILKCFNLKKIVLPVLILIISGQGAFAAGNAAGFTAGGCVQAVQESDVEASVLLGLTYKRETFPFYFYAGSAFSGIKPDNIFVSFDYHLFDSVIGSSFVHWYTGPGFSLGYDFDEGAFIPELRLVLGTGYFVSYGVEVFAQIFAEGGMQIADSKSFCGSMNAEAGIRFYF